MNGPMNVKVTYLPVYLVTRYIEIMVKVQTDQCKA